MSAPRLVEVRIAVAELQQAVEAWQYTLGFEVTVAPAEGEATLEAGGCILRLIETADAAPGLDSIVLGVTTGAGEIDAALSHGVPIRLVEEQP